VLFCKPALLFNSVQYWIFLPLVWLLYFAMPVRLRWIWLLAASYFFYGFWKVEFAGLMALTSVIDWQCGLRVQPGKAYRKFWLWFSILSNVGMLFMFKYFDFALGDSELAKKLYASNLTAWLIELGKYTIPAGISFYTFQSISYVVDVYRGEEKPENNLFRFMLFVSFFPQLVAGPIERFGKLHSQLFSAYMPRWNDVQAGLRLLLYGLFLKVCVADNLAHVVDQYYAQPSAFAVDAAYTAVLAFAFQVYTDFFGYSLLAQGSALLFGIHLMDNFNKPFIAKSIPEFWHRWHISLSTWFRDYIFVPVGGNRRGPLVLAFAVLLVFFTSGLWHGANTTMIVFGLSQGILYLFDRFLFNRLPISGKSWDVFRTIKTVMLFTITLVWFRSVNMPQSSEVFRHLTGGIPSSGKVTMLDIPIQTPIFLLIFIILDVFVMKKRADIWFEERALPVRRLLYLFMLLSLFMLGGAVNHPFVYFQF
jgi:D-alanyl-lipoteichoic acid acyltransferase DltB (MBOAT superfamily)